MAAIRGAICAQNTAEDISQKAVQLVSAIIKSNGLSPNDVEAIVFSATTDLNKCYPATAVRKQLNLPHTAFFCVNEMRVDGTLDHCLRVLIITNGYDQAKVKHCYLGRAQVLRPDLKED